jgi:arylsulfatase A-like enzyme
MWEYVQKHAHLYEDVDIPEPANLFDDYRNRGEAIKRATQKIGMEETLFLHNTQGNQFSDVRAKIGKLDPVERKRKAYQYFIKAYLRCVASLDENVGRVLNYLDESGLAGNTIVIYTSDQGVFLGEHGLFDKRFMYEESIRMPFLVRYPKDIKAGSVNNDIILNIDFAETLLDYAGLSIPKDMQGRSLKPLFRGENPINRVRTRKRPRTRRRLFMAGADSFIYKTVFLVKEAGSGSGAAPYFPSIVFPSTPI